MAARFPRADRVELGYYELSTHLLALEVLARGLPITWHNRAFFTTRIGGRLVGFWCTRSSLNTAVGVKAAVRKDVAAKLLRAGGLSIARGGVFRDPEPAADYADRIGFPVVVKPASGRKSRGVTAGVRDRGELRRAWRLAAGGSRRRIIVERLFEGEEARFLVVGQECVAVTKKLPPSVVGDGQRTVGELIEAKNEARRSNIHLGARLIELDEHRRDHIRSAGFDVDDVPPQGLRLLIDRKSSLQAGGDSIDVTDEVHPTYRSLAVDAVRSFPGIEIAGVDLIARDFDKAASRRGYIIVEVNTMPGLGAHHFPLVGTPRNGARAIVEHHAVLMEAK